MVVGTSSLPSTKDSRRAMCQGLQTWSQKTTFSMLNTLYLHTSQSQSGHLMQYTRSFSLLSINKDPFKHLRYNRLRELHKLLFYFIKDYWFKIKLCHDQSTLSDLHSTILRVKIFPISIFYSYKFPPSTKYVKRCTFNSYKHGLKTTIWQCQQSSHPPTGTDIYQNTYCGALVKITLNS